MTEINHAIGAEGIISAECKEVVSQYGDLIWELLVSGVSFLLPFSLHFTVYINVSHFRFNELFRHGLQVQPDKVCAQLGLCIFNGNQSVRLEN